VCFVGCLLTSRGCLLVKMLISLGVLDSKRQIRSCLLILENFFFFFFFFFSFLSSHLISSGLLPPLEKQRSLTLDKSEPALGWVHAEYQALQRAKDEGDERVLMAWERAQSVPVNVFLGAAVQISSVSCGLAHAAALSFAGELFTWGANDFGQLGRSSAAGGLTPVPERALFALYLRSVEPRITQVSCGARHTIAITDRSAVLAFGDNMQGQCGYAASAPPRKVNVMTFEQTGQPLYGAAVSCGSNHSLIVAVHGEVFACGDNSSGQLGTGDLNPRLLVLLLRFRTRFFFFFFHPLILELVLVL
jgi:hypothetical protein